MTYDEIKSRLAQVETALQSLQTTPSPALDSSYASTSIEQLTTIKESLKQQLAEAEETMFVSTKGGDTKAVQMDRKTAMDLKKDPAITGIDTAKGAKIKEQEGISFTVEETKAIAKSVGKALLKALKQAGDEVARIKAHRLEENSFDIHVTYKGESGDDEFSFYIQEDTLHLVDFSFDKELVNVGVKPSGEAIVHVDHLANELLKHFKSLNEGAYDNYKPKHFDICPGAETLRDKLIDGGKSEAELGEWTKLHDDLFKLEKAVIKANKADQKHVEAAKKLRSQIIHISRDLNIDADDISYLKSHVEKIEKIASGKNIEEGVGKHYIKVTRREYKDTMHFLDNNQYGADVADIVDNDGAGNVIIYFKDGDNLYDIVMDLAAFDIDVVDHNADLDERMDLNDPLAIRLRAAKMNRDKKVDKPKQLSPKKAELLRKLKLKRAQVMRDMEQEAEPEGGPIADRYGDELNKIDTAIAKLTGINEGIPTAFDDESMDALLQIILKYVEDPDDAEKLVQQVDDHGLDSLPSDIEAQLERDPEFDAWYHKLHYGSDADTDYMQRRRAEKDYNEHHDMAGQEPPADDHDDLDVGHQDDEPNMLKKDLYDVATYAAKLYKQLDKYDKFDGEVDFPHWWQKKVTLAREYMSAAQHYLEAEEKQPAIDQLALEGKESEGQMAAAKGKKYDENPYEKGTKDHLEWSKGHNQARAKKLSLKEDWGSSDQYAMNQSIHKSLGEPKEFPGLSQIMDAAEDAVDFYWDDWEEYKTDREGLVMYAAQRYANSMFPDFMAGMRKMFAPIDESVNEGTELYDRNGIHIKRFSGGSKGVMVQITIGDKYIVVSAAEYPFLVRAMQSVQGDLKDMSRQYPRSKNMNEASAAKIQKAHGQVVAKMKELAKQYKAGDKSVVGQLKDLTAKKKELEKHLEKAVAGIGRGQELNELSGDQQEALIELQNILDQASGLGEEAREIIRQTFPKMLSKADAYGAFDFGTSANRYDTTLGSIIDEIEEYYDEEEEDMDEGKYKSDAQRKAIYATKAEKGELKEIDGGSLFDYFEKKGYEVNDRRPDGYPPKPGVKGYSVSRGSGRYPQIVIFQHNPETDQFTISQMSGYRIDQKDAIKAGMRQAGRSGAVGIDSYMTDGNYNPVDISAEGLKDIVDHVMSGLDREAKAQADFYRARGNTSGTIDEQFKVGDKVTYLGHPGVITKVNKEMTGAITYNVAYDKGQGRTKATNIYNKGGEIKAINENKATCCGKCGRVHVKGTKCKTPYLKGKDHCRYN